MRQRLAPLLLLLFVGLVLVPAPASAFNPFGDSTCKSGTPEAQNSAACNTSNSDPIAGPDGILLKITNIVAYLGGAIALIMILVSAVRFITSGSDVSTGSRTDTDVEDARRSIVSALVGLAVIILGRAIITYVIRRL